MSFRLTYATMFDPPEEMHERFEKALATMRGRLGATHPMHIGGKDVPAGATDERASPIDSELRIGCFPHADASEVDAAVAAAQRAFPAWRDAGMARRVALMREVAAILEERVYEIAAALVLEVGKNRLEALGEAQECVDFFNVYADDFEAHRGYEFDLPNDPSPAFVSRNRSVMRPYGVWAVIAPFNFPIALAAGPTAAALVTGNTVVLKCASDTPWAGRLLADCIRDAGLPAGVFNYVNGPGAAIGEQLVRDSRVAGVTFTGSVTVGRAIMAEMAAGRYPRPYIAEMGARIRPSSRRTRTSTAPPPASRVRPTAWAGRSAPRSRACTCTRKWRTRSCRGSRRKSTGSGSAIRPSGRRDSARSSTSARTNPMRVTSRTSGAGARTSAAAGSSRPRASSAAATTSSRCSRKRIPRIRCGSTRCSCRS